jgi:hypothetical protein
MPSGTGKQELGRGERVLPGVWRLRLPLPYPGVPHCNAWAVAAGDGIVLFDTGMHEPGSMAHLERAMEQVNLRVEHVRLVVCTQVADGSNRANMPRSPTVSDMGRFAPLCSRLHGLHAHAESTAHGIWRSVAREPVVHEPVEHSIRGGGYACRCKLRLVNLLGGLVPRPTSLKPPPRNGRRWSL